jgi:N-acetylmuramoyl-L-alanine amidase
VKRVASHAAGSFLLALLLLGGGSSLADQSLQDPFLYQRLDLTAPELTVEVTAQDEPGPRRLAGRRLLEGSQEVYLQSADVALIFKGRRFWQEAVRQLTLRIQGEDFVVTASTRLVIHGEDQTLLPVPVFMYEGDLWLPIVFLTDEIGAVLGEPVQWDPSARRLSIGSTRFNVTQLRIEELTRATALHLVCEKPLSFRAESQSPDLLMLKLYAGSVDPAAVRRVRPQGLIERLELQQAPDHARLYVQVDELADRFRTYVRDEGREIVLVVEEEQVAALPAPVPRGKLNLALEEDLVDVTRTIDVRTVVIDPGHGGVEVGREGKQGVMEKDINLAVAQQLAQLLRHQGLEVVLTREDDSQVELERRSEIANQASGDLFISLHCNGWFNESAHGIETYFLSPAESEWSSSVATVENSAGGDRQDVAFIIWELVQNRFISASSDLAETIQGALTHDLGSPDRGVKQAGFRVLVGAQMPAVLVEMGFLSHPGEASRLADSGYQRRLAQALTDAVMLYKERHARSADFAGRGAE